MKRLKEIRLSRGLTQFRLGILSKMNQPTICMIERGHLIPTEEHIFKLSKALRVTPEELQTKVLKNNVCKRKKIPKI